MPNSCSCSHYMWCPELKRCIPHWKETCPIRSDVEFSGGTRLSCRRCRQGARCAAPQDNMCSWHWDDDEDDVYGAVFATYYWTDLSGHFYIPKRCTGIKCSGCHLSEDDSWADRWRMYMLDRRNVDPVYIAIDVVIRLLPWVIVPVCLWRCGMHRKIAPRRIRHAIITRSVRPAFDV